MLHRVVEAVCIRLCVIHRRDTQEGEHKWGRWGMIMRDYAKIRTLVVNNARVMAETTIQLFEINLHTLTTW